METNLPKFISTKVLHKGDWLILNEITFEVKKKEMKFEYVSRPEHLRSPNGSMIIPILRKNGKKYLILTANFRPAIESYSLEFPGGFADEGESLEECVHRFEI